MYLRICSVYIHVYSTTNEKKSLGFEKSRQGTEEDLKRGNEWGK